jgi:hypothetical protein
LFHIFVDLLQQKPATVSKKASKGLVEQKKEGSSMGIAAEDILVIEEYERAEEL